MTLRDQIKEHGSIRKAAIALGIPRSTLQYRLKREPEQNISDLVPDDFGIERSTITVEPDGTLGRQWIKTRFDPQIFREQLDEIREGFNSTLNKEEPCDFNQLSCVDSDLVTTYIVTDYHFGMLAWGEETGADWDIDIAEKGFKKYFDHAVSITPNSELAIFANIGDLFHFTGMLPVTPAHGNILDADTRFQKLIRVAIRSIRYAIRRLLEKHKRVHIIHAVGNHDDSASAWLREMFKEFYENETRITVDTRPDPYYCYEHGLTSLFFHHGHRKRIGSIDAVFASKFRQVFGRTKYSYGHMGHLHHSEVKETSLMVLEQHRTLAAPDAYASSGGWLSGRSACAITYSKYYGELSRVTIPWEMLKV